MALADAKDCLGRIDNPLAQASFGDEAIAAYTLHRGRFHQVLAALSGSDVIVRQIERATRLHCPRQPAGGRR